MNCPEPGCTVIGYCRFHAKLNPVVKEKKVYKIPTESKKRKKDKKVLLVIKAGMMIKLDGECQLKGPNCQYFAMDYEHIQKSSPKNYIDPNNATLSCRNCNRDKELFPELFKDHSVSRFKK
jgi:5-methylcytosine-specific restriction endonuclease McrA